MRKTEMKRAAGDVRVDEAVVDVDRTAFGPVGLELAKIPEFCYLLLFKEAFRVVALGKCGSAPLLSEVRAIMRPEWFDCGMVSRLALSVTAGGFCLLHESSTPTDYTGLWDVLLFSSMEELSSDYREVLAMGTGPERNVFAVQELACMPLPSVVGDYVAAAEELQRVAAPRLALKRRETVFPVGEGFCYLAAFPHSRRSAVADELGPHPSEASVAAALVRETGSEVAEGIAVEKRGEKAHVYVATGANWRPAARGTVAVGDTGAVFSEWLVSVLGRAEVDKIHSADMALVVRSMAFHSPEQKQRFRMLEMLGDSVATLVLVENALRDGVSVQHAQETRSVMLGNANLCKLFSGNFPTGCFMAPAGVSFTNSSVGAKAVEAVVGMVYHSCGHGPAAALIDHLLLGDAFRSQAEARRLHAWDCEENRPEEGRKGCSYLRLFREDCRGEVVKRLGLRPSFGRVMAEAPESFDLSAWPGLWLETTDDPFVCDVVVGVSREPGARPWVDVWEATVTRFPELFAGSDDFPRGDVEGDPLPLVVRLGSRERGTVWSKITDTGVPWEARRM